MNDHDLLAMISSLKNIESGSTPVGFRDGDYGSQSMSQLQTLSSTLPTNHHTQNNISDNNNKYFDQRRRSKRRSKTGSKKEQHRRRRSKQPPFARQQQQTQPYALAWGKLSSPTSLAENVRINIII